MISRTNKRTAKIAYFAVIHGIYFEQFPGLKENLYRYHDELLQKVKANDVEVVDFGFVDSSERSFEVAKEIQKMNPDVVFCNMITYATSSVFAPIMKEVNAPMVLLALQPRQALDYSKANTFMQLENDNICSVPEFTGVAIRFGMVILLTIVTCLACLYGFWGNEYLPELSVGPLWEIMALVIGICALILYASLITSSLKLFLRFKLEHTKLITFLVCLILPLPFVYIYLSKKELRILKKRS